MLALVTVLEIAMRKIRVLVANYPRLMRDLVLATVSDQPDIEVLGALDDESQIAKVVAETQPDFVIVGLDRPNQRPAICDYLLSRYPLVKVLAVAAGQDNSVFFWSDIRSAAIESSEESILNVIRGKRNQRFERVM